MAKIIGPEGKIFIFEPYNVSNAIVTKNMEINNLNDRATIFQKGASDKTSKAAYQLDSVNTGGSSIIEDNEKFLRAAENGGKNSRYFVVETIPVD